MHRFFVNILVYPPGIRQGHVIRGDNLLNRIEILFRLNQEIPTIKIQIPNKYQWSNLNLQTRPLERRTRGNTLEC